jgi:hypothetical protein
MKRYLSILAVAFSGIGVYLFDKIWGDQINWDKFRKLDIGEFLATPITVLEILIFITLFLIIYFLLKKVFKKDSIYNKKQRKLREYDHLKDSETDILFRWEVYFDFGGQSFVSNLKAFCDKHQGPPIRFVNNRCPDLTCENNKQEINLLIVKNYIESDLIDKWKKMK